MPLWRLLWARLSSKVHVLSSRECDGQWNPADDSAPPSIPVATQPRAMLPSPAPIRNPVRLNLLLPPLLTKWATHRS